MRVAADVFSNPKNIAIIGAVTMAVVVSIVVMKSHAIRVHDEIAVLRTEMSPFVPPVADTSSDLSSLRSQRYAIETRFDPLIALAGSETDGMRKALIPLQNEAQEILGSYSPEERAKIEPVLYARTFLSLLPELEDMRRSIIRSPSSASVRRYNSLLKKTIQAYREDIVLYKDTLASFPENDQRSTLNYLVGTTSITNIIVKLEQLDRQALVLETKREKRYRCFTGERSACTPLAASFATLVKDNPPITPTQSPTALARSLTHRDIVREAFSEMLGPQETRDSIVKLSHSECLPDKRAAYYYFFESREEEDIFSSTATPLNDLYFYDLEQSVQSQKNPPAYLRKLYENGLRYNFQNIGNLYFCPNSGHVLSNAATLVSLHDKLTHAPLFADRPDEFPDLSRLEKQVVSAAIPDEADMDRYISAVADTLRIRGEQNIGAHIGAQKLFELEEMIQEWKNRSSHFERSLTAAHHINRLSKGIITQSKAPVYFFLVARVYSSIFFMTFNQSITGEPFLLLDSVQSQPDLANFHLVPYNNSLLGRFHKGNAFDELRYEQKIIDAVLEVER